jgi:hypothetical protein
MTWPDTELKFESVLQTEVGRLLQLEFIFRPCFGVPFSEDDFFRKNKIQIPAHKENHTKSKEPGSFSSRQSSIKIGGEIKKKYFFCF